MIAKDALVYAQQGKRKTLQRKDLGEWAPRRFRTESLDVKWGCDCHKCAHHGLPCHPFIPLPDNAIEAIDEFAFLEGKHHEAKDSSTPHLIGLGQTLAFRCA